MFSSISQMYVRMEKMRWHIEIERWIGKKPSHVILCQRNEMEKIRNRHSATKRFSESRFSSFLSINLSMHSFMISEFDTDVFQFFSLRWWRWNASTLKSWWITHTNKCIHWCDDIFVSSLVEAKRRISARLYSIRHNWNAVKSFVKHTFLICNGWNFSIYFCPFKHSDKRMKCTSNNHFSETKWEKKAFSVRERTQCHKVTSNHSIFILILKFQNWKSRSFACMFNFWNILLFSWLFQTTFNFIRVHKCNFCFIKTRKILLFVCEVVSFQSSFCFFFLFFQFANRSKWWSSATCGQ